jgi:hypothetical protein
MRNALGAIAMVLGSLVTFASTSGWGGETTTSVDLVVISPPGLAQPVSNSTPKPNVAKSKEVVVSVERGANLEIEATFVNLGTNDSGPFDVRFYLADRANGQGVVHEFDVVKTLKIPGQGRITVQGEYVMPFYPVVAGRSYWLVAEADLHGEVAEVNEGNNRTILSTVSVPCDDFLKEEYVSEYLCPKRGEND